MACTGTHRVTDGRIRGHLAGSGESHARRDRGACRLERRRRRAPVVLPGRRLPSREIIEQLGLMRDRLAAGKGISKTSRRTCTGSAEACSVDEEPPRTRRRRRAVHHRGAVPASALRAGPPLEQPSAGSKARHRPGHIPLSRISARTSYMNDRQCRLRLGGRGMDVLRDRLRA